MDQKNQTATSHVSQQRFNIVLSSFLILIQVEGALFEKRSYGYNESRLKLSIKDTIVITKHFYPPLSIMTLFSSLGGVLGLWLGMGIMQILDYGIVITKYFPKFQLE